MQAGLQLSSSQESSLLAARRTLLASLCRLANARSEILAALGMQLLQTHRVSHEIQVFLKIQRRLFCSSYAMLLDSDRAFVCVGFADCMLHVHPSWPSAIVRLFRTPLQCATCIMLSRWPARLPWEIS